MTTAYSQKDSETLAYIKQVAVLAVINKVISWRELDEFEYDVLKNVNGIKGLKPESHKFIRKIENFIDECTAKAC